MEKRKVRAMAGLALFVTLTVLFFVNQLTSTSTPTAIYTPGPRQPRVVPTSSSARPHPHPGTSSVLTHRPTVASPEPRATSPQGTRYGTRPPLTHRPTHRPAPPTHAPKPPAHRPPPLPPLPPKPPTKPPGVLCRLLGICITNGVGLGIWLRP